MVVAQRLQLVVTRMRMRMHVLMLMLVLMLVLVRRLWMRMSVCMRVMRQLTDSSCSSRRLIIGWQCLIPCVRLHRHLQRHRYRGHCRGHGRRCCWLLLQLRHCC